MSSRIKNLPAEVLANRLDWERGVTAGGKDAKAGVFKVPQGTRAWEHGYRYGQKLELRKIKLDDMRFAS